MSRVSIANMVAVILCAALSLNAAADGAAGYNTQTVIGGSVGHEARGVLGVNMASGDANLQSNAMALSTSTGPAAAHANVVQAIGPGLYSAPDVAVAKIEGGAFSNAAGAIGINQAAGVVNAQANSVAIAIGVGAEVTADAELAQSVSGPTFVNGTASGQYRETAVAESAFRGARGIVQVNQSAGLGNATGNSFAMRIQMGAMQ